MAKLDPKKAKLFEANTRACFKNIQALYKARKWSGLAASLSEDTVLFLGKSQRTIVGEKRIIDFWRQLRSRGLEDVKFNIQKLTLRPADFLVVTKAGYAQYDMVADIFGQAVFTFRKRDGQSFSREVEFAGEKPHITICQGRLRTIYLNF